MEKVNTHRLIREEFRSVLSNEPYRLPTHTDAVMVLSAAPEKDVLGSIVTEASEENIARIKFGIDLLKQIAAKKAGVDPLELTEDEFYYFAPPLFLNGETEQLPAMKQIATSTGFDPDYIEEIDCGKRGIGNTKMQFTVFKDNPQFVNIKHLTVVTTDYHGPRVFRTADKNLPSHISFDVIPMPHEVYNYPVYKVIRGEVKRIQTYVAKGDISNKANS